MLSSGERALVFHKFVLADTYCHDLRSHENNLLSLRLLNSLEVGWGTDGCGTDMNEAQGDLDFSKIYFYKLVIFK